MLNNRGHKGQTNTCVTQDLPGILPETPDTPRHAVGMSPQARLEAIASILAVAALRRRLRKTAEKDLLDNTKDIPPAPRRRT